MKPVRPASIEEVLAATPTDPETRKVVTERGVFWCWQLDVADVGTIQIQLPNDCRRDLGMDPRWNGIGPIRELHAYWTRWIHSSHKAAERELATHNHFVSEIGRLRKFATRPILLGLDKQVHDGKHRLLAAFELTTVGHSEAYADALQFEVFWNQSEQAQREIQ